MTMVGEKRMYDGKIKDSNQIIENYKKSLPQLKVLIFGPSEQNPFDYARKCFNKRVNIKKCLLDKNCIAILPEEEFKEAKKQGKDIQNITAFEKYLIEHECDLAVFLLVPKCPGVDHELSVFSILPECVKKILLFYAKDCDYESNWTLEDKIDFIEGGNGRVESFCQDDIVQCRVQEKILQEIEKVRRVLSMLPHKKYRGVE